MRIEVWVYDAQDRFHRCSIFSDWRNALACLAYEHMGQRWVVRAVNRPPAIQLVIQP